MTELQKRILAVFDEYIFGFMRTDINAAITGKANYLAALGLVTYTEVLGAFEQEGLVRGGQARQISTPLFHTSARTMN